MAPDPTSSAPCTAPAVRACSLVLAHWPVGSWWEALHFLAPASHLCPLPGSVTSSLCRTLEVLTSHVLSSIWKLLEIVPDKKASLGLVSKPTDRGGRDWKEFSGKGTLWGK